MALWAIEPRFLASHDTKPERIYFATALELILRANVASFAVADKNIAALIDEVLIIASAGVSKRIFIGRNPNLPLQKLARGDVALIIERILDVVLNLRAINEPDKWLRFGLLMPYLPRARAKR
jgi:hypothetical protein